MRPIHIPETKQHCCLFSRYNCEKIWGAFEKAYVGRDPCEVPMEAYDPFIAAAHFKPACGRVNSTQSVHVIHS